MTKEEAKKKWFENRLTRGIGSTVMPSNVKIVKNWHSAGFFMQMKTKNTAKHGHKPDATVLITALWIFLEQISIKSSDQELLPNPQTMGTLGKRLKRLRKDAEKKVITDEKA